MLLLLVAPDADRHAAHWVWPGVEVTSATTEVAAHAYLAGAAFDVVAVQQGPMAEALRLVHQSLGLDSVLHVYAGPDACREWIGRRLGLVPTSSDLEGGEPAGAEGQAPGREEALHALRDEIGHLVHALNNPLAVIAGNAQLGVEMGQAMGADASLVALFREIDEAANRLGRLFGDVRALRSRLDALSG